VLETSHYMKPRGGRKMSFLHGISIEEEQNYSSNVKWKPKQFAKWREVVTLGASLKRELPGVEHPQRD